MAARASERAARLAALQRTIETETAAVVRLHALLLREQQLLIAAEPEGLLALVAEKQSALTEVEDRARSRQTLMAAAGLPGDPDQAELRMSGHRSLAAAWRSLRRVARDARIANSLNGSLAERRLRFVSARLDVLRGASGHAGTYCPDGRSTDARASGRIIAAA